MTDPQLELVRRAQAGDRAAVAALVEQHQRYVYSIAMTILRDPNEAADLTQDAFIRVMRSLGSYRGETKFTTWLYRLVVNLGIDRLRRRGMHVASLDDAAAIIDVASENPADDAPALIERGEQAEAIRRALDRLPDAQRLALTLHYFEDLRYEDIAEVMGLPVNTVKSHIRRGKERLARSLRPVLEGDPVMGGCA
ncbi:MAG: sigma-70 family RNA polymerase sigma factor [Chloroflexi bacterium]|nr:sigma-70 family RNA polymerase sigma factor [Chloroflexota bacterium]